MKALSIRQPFATLLCLGVKHYETRTWKTAYRGPIAIHASSIFDPPARELCVESPIRDLLATAGYRTPLALPLGKILGLAKLVDCVPTKELRSLDEDQLRLGDFRPGRWAWRFRTPKLLRVPLPAKGKLSLFDLDLAELAREAWPLFAAKNGML
jgi:hypothetical protein